MRLYCLYIIAAIIITVGCRNNEKAKLIPRAEIVFDLPFEPTLIPIGYCDRGDTQNSFYYFADFRTSKQIAFCDGQGRVISTINLKPWINNNDPWYFMQVRSMDSIVTITGNHNELFFFDRQHIIYRYLLPPVPYLGVPYTFYTGPEPPDLGFKTAFSYIEIDRKDFVDYKYRASRLGCL